MPVQTRGTVYTGDGASSNSTTIQWDVPQVGDLLICVVALNGDVYTTIEGTQPPAEMDLRLALIRQTRISFMPKAKMAASSALTSGRQSGRASIRSRERTSSRNVTIGTRLL